MDIISVSSKGQIVIPEKVRKNLKIKEGSKLALFEQDGVLLLKKEEDVEKIIYDNQKKEMIGWMLLAEKSLKDIWDNPKDDKHWSRYL